MVMIRRHYACLWVGWWYYVLVMSPMVDVASAFLSPRSCQLLLPPRTTMSRVVDDDVLVVPSVARFPISRRNNNGGLFETHRLLRNQPHSSDRPTGNDTTTTTDTVHRFRKKRSWRTAAFLSIGATTMGATSLLGIMNPIRGVSRGTLTIARVLAATAAAASGVLVAYSWRQSRHVNPTVSTSTASETELSSSSSSSSSQSNNHNTNGKEKKKTLSWVKNRLGEVQERERMEMERQAAHLRQQQDERKARGQQWATQTLVITETALAKATDQRAKKDEANRRAKLWAASIARQSQETDRAFLEEQQQQ